MFGRSNFELHVQSAMTMELNVFDFPGMEINYREYWKYTQKWSECSPSFKYYLVLDEVFTVKFYSIAKMDLTTIEVIATFKNSEKIFSVIWNNAVEDQ